MENEDNKIDKRPLDWRPGMLLFAKVSGYIAFPVIFALYLGKYLDGKFHTDPWIFLILTGVAFLVSIFSIWTLLKVYIKSLENKEK